MPEIATAAVIGGSLLSGAGAMAQGEANSEAAAMIGLMAKKFGKEQLADLEGIDYDPVQLMELLDEAGTLVDFGFNESREKAYGAGNLEAVDQLQSDALGRAGFDFSSLPQDMLRALDQGTLARTAGGPAGLAENISLQNRIALAEAGFSQFQQLSANNASFTPNPVGTLFDLGKFQTGQQQLDIETDMRRIGTELDIQRFKFEAMAGAIQQRAANDSTAIGLTAAGSLLTSVGSGISSGGLQSTLGGASASMQNTSASLISSITGR